MAFQAPPNSISNEFDPRPFAESSGLMQQANFEYGPEAFAQRAAAALDQHSANLQNIMQARQNYDQQGEAWELEKKQKALDLEKAKIGNNFTQTQIAMMEAMMKQQNKQHDDINNAKEILLNDAEERIRNAANQAKQGLAASLQAIMANGVSAPKAQTEIPNNLSVGRSLSKPVTLPSANGAAVVGAEPQAGLNTEMFPGYEVDPNSFLSGQLKFVKKQKETAGQVDETVSKLAETLPQLDDSSTDEEKQAWLAQLPRGTASLIANLADYKMDLSKVSSIRGNQRQKLAELVSLYDPNFDMNKYGQRQKWLGSLASGDGNKQILRINTAMGHILTLKNAFDELHNSGIVPWNRVVNAAKTGFGEPAPKKVAFAGNAVADELETIFRMQGGTEEGIRAWRKNFDDASSPEQQTHVLNEALELLASRIDALRQQNKNIMGKDNLQVLFPHSIEAIKSIEGAKVEGPKGGRVTVKSPDGKQGSIPEEQLDEALAQGYTRI